VKLLRKLLILSHRYLGIALCLLVAMCGSRAGS
jgi:hypothetical protein